MTFLVTKSEFIPLCFKFRNHLLLRFGVFLTAYNIMPSDNKKDKKKNPFTVQLVMSLVKMID